MAREVIELNENRDPFSLSSLKLYETQFFGFTPQTCMLRISSSFQDCVSDMLQVVEQVCVRQLSGGGASDEDLRHEAQESRRKLQQLLEQRFQQLFQRVEALLVKKCFSVPPNVLLPEDKTHSSGKGDLQEMLRLESSLADLHRAYEAEVCARQALQAELEEQAEVQRQLDRILLWIQELQMAWVKGGNGTAQESFCRVWESVNKLQEGVRELLSHHKTQS